MTEDVFNNILKGPLTKDAKIAEIARLTGSKPEVIKGFLDDVLKPGFKLFGKTFGSNKGSIAGYFAKQAVKHAKDQASRKRSDEIYKKATSEWGKQVDRKRDAQVKIDKYKKGFLKERRLFTNERLTNNLLKGELYELEKDMGQKLDTRLRDTEKLKRSSPSGRVKAPKSAKVSQNRPRGLYGDSPGRQLRINAANKIARTTPFGPSPAPQNAIRPIPKRSNFMSTDQLLKGIKKMEGQIKKLDNKSVIASRKIYQNRTFGLGINEFPKQRLSNDKILPLTAENMTKPLQILRRAAKISKNVGAGLAINYVLDKTLSPVAEGAGRWLASDVLIPAARALDDLMPGMNSADERRRHRLNKYYQNLDEESN